MDWDGVEVRFRNAAPSGGKIWPGDLSYFEWRPLDVFIQAKARQRRDPGEVSAGCRGSGKGMTKY